ncbi:hypothetical protein V6N13_135023 [Hibiscus sabdariffa]
MVDSVGDWEWDLLRHRLSPQVLLRLAAIHRPKPSFPMDSIGWKLREDRQFSVQTAYHVRCGEVVCTVDPMWKVEDVDRVLSADALRMLQRRCPKSGLFTITGHLFQLYNKDWCLAFSKVARRNNGVADVLAKLASDASFSVGMEAD